MPRVTWLIVFSSAILAMAYAVCILTPADDSRSTNPRGNAHAPASPRTATVPAHTPDRPWSLPPSLPSTPSEATEHDDASAPTPETEPPSAVEACGTGNWPCPAFDQSIEMRQAMVRCAVLVYDLPLGLEEGRPPKIVESALERAGVDEAERSRIAAVEQRLFTEFEAEVRDLHFRGFADRAAADQKSVVELVSDLKAASDAGDPAYYEARRRLVKERAGMYPAGSTVQAHPLAMGYLDLLARSGDRFEALLAEELGRERARAAREAGFGGRTVSSTTCSDE